jgi:hypothetical protein
MAAPMMAKESSLKRISVMAIPVKGFATNLTKWTEYPFRFVKFVAGLPVSATNFTNYTNDLSGSAQG